MEKYLDLEGLQYLCGKMKKELDGKQKRLTGQPGQLIGLDEQGARALVITSGRNVALEQGSSKLTIHALVPGKNLLDNWYFLAPINQRGQTEYSNTDLVYTIDRWLCGRANLKLNPAGAFISWNGSNESCCLMQRISGASLPYGTVVTASLLTNIGLQTFTCTLTSGMAAVGGITSDGSLNILHRNGNFEFAIQTTATEFRTLIAAKLELGSQQTLAHKEGDIWVLNDPPPDPTLELLTCQRYYWQSGKPFVLCNYYDANYGLSDVNFPVQMISIPACTITSVNGTMGVLSDWAMSFDTDIKVCVNRGGLCEAGFSGINTSGVKVFDVGRKYSFKVIADANL